MDLAHIEVLRRGPRAWNAWREQNPSQIPDLGDAALSLSERQLGPANGGPINLRGAHISGAFLRSACLSGADLEAADLSEAQLNSAYLDRANLTAANLAHAVLDHTNLRGAVLTNANLTGASLRGVQNLTQAQINETICDLTTTFPEHLIHPLSTLEVVRRVSSVSKRNVGEDQFFSPIVCR